MENKKNILITGATGFTGKHLLEDIFSSSNNYNISILSRKENPDIAYRNKINVFKGDLSEIKTIEAAFSGIDILINLAAEINNADKFESANITGIKNIISLAEKFGIKKIIHLSSVGVVGAQYSSSRKIIYENSPCFPSNEYERTKLESEKLLLDASLKNNFDLVILRPTNVFGDFHPKMFLLNFLSHLKNQKLFIMVKNSYVNYVYVKDVTGAICYFITNSSQQKVFNIGSTLNLSEFVNIASELLEVKPLILMFPKMILKFLNTLNYLGISTIKNKFRAISNKIEYDDTKLAELLKYRYGINEGLKMTISYYKSIGKI